jgi:hypothetical protein
MFGIEERDRVRDHLLEMAHADPRVVAGAMVGALAGGGGDRWSDLDLTFGLADGVLAAGVLDDWTAELGRRFDAVHLFDLPFLSSIYRVLLLPGTLQVDLSFTPGAEFGALGPRFELLFGAAVERAHPPRSSAQYLFGLGAHHAVRARFCIERGRLWQAEHWISGVRDQALSLACRRRGLEAANGRGFDELPAELLRVAGDALVRSVERGELLRALERAVEALLREADDVRDLASKVEPQLRGLSSASWS